MGKKIHACPVCGRFVSEKQISKYRGLESECLNLKVNNIWLSEELNQKLRAIVETEEYLATLRKTVRDQAKHIAHLTAELNDTEATLCLREEEIERIYARNWWERMLNMIPE